MALIGGTGFLILSMAAIGAVYELEQTQANALFDACTKAIQLYRKVRRKEDANRVEVQTPLWLVQTMLLNVAYGLHCGDQMSGEMVSKHCETLVGLARSADLLQPQAASSGTLQDSHSTDEEPSSDPWGILPQESPKFSAEWRAWKTNEERKRTLYGIFMLSSLLVAAYNHAPVLSNAEIHLDLPCDEEFWTSGNEATFKAMGGAQMAEQGHLTFSYALKELLSASIRDIPQSNIRPSTFACLILINALHGYIWETRQRDDDGIWTIEEAETMYRHVEPALKAWQAAWASSPDHSRERPNPHGHGPLSADCIPLLDLAHVRLLMNLDRSKEKFWQRDYDGMAEELARGSEIIQHEEQLSGPILDSWSDPSDLFGASGSFGGSLPSSSILDFAGPFEMIEFANPSEMIAFPTPPDVVALPNPSDVIADPKSQKTITTSPRELHLRRAAFYAAESLSMSDKLGVTFADWTSRELPLQSAMCAFDCAQVLAEWVASVQERTGRYVGVLGPNTVLTLLPATMLLEEEDRKLLGKIKEIFCGAEIKINSDLAHMNAMTGMTEPQPLSAMNDAGYGPKILGITAYMLDAGAAWPVTHLMAQALETQANHVRRRVEKSVENYRDERKIM